MLVQHLLLLLDSQEEFLYSQLLKKSFLITIKDNATTNRKVQSMTPLYI
jgi:hypothetical protein